VERRCFARMITHYETLGISDSAKPEQIKRSYRRLVKQLHPDLFPAASEEQIEAEQQLRLVNAAYSVLSHPQKRASYDSKLNSRKASYAHPDPEYCERCGKPTLYWQVGRKVHRCNDCRR
jgi:curved DNA-binding protein CbpA